MRSFINRIPNASFLIGGGLVLILLLALLVPSIAQIATAQTPPGGPGGGNPGGGGSSASCATNITYYAYQASNAGGAGSSANFGPDQKFANTGEGIARFDKKRCEDPLWLAATEQFFAHGENMDQKVAEERAALFVKDHAAWKAAADSVRDQIGKVELANSTERFDSLGMTLGDNPNVMPKLMKFAELPVMGQTLKFTLKNGQVRELRALCDLQASVPKLFTKVIVEEKKPEKKPEEKPVCTTNCNPTTPGCTVNCNPVCTVNCNPVCTVNCLEAKIPAQDPYPNGNSGNGGGRNADPGPGAYIDPGQMQQPPSTPYVAPAPPAAKPAPVGNEPAPAPIETPRTIPTVEPGANPAPAPGATQPPANDTKPTLPSGF